MVRHTSNSSRRALALVMTLLTVIVLAIVVSQLVYSTAIDLRVASNHASMAQNDIALTSAASLVMAKLDMADELHGEEAYHALNDPWAQEFEHEFGEDTILEIKVVDHERRFNLLRLVEGEEADQERAKKAFIALLENVRPDTNPGPESLVDRIITWMKDKTGWKTPEKGSSQPLVAKGSSLPLVSLDDLTLVDGIDSGFLDGEEDENGKYTPGIRYYVTIQSNQKINLNTASKAVLMTLSPDITNEIAEAVVEARGGGGSEPDDGRETQQSLAGAETESTPFTKVDDEGVKNLFSEEASSEEAEWAESKKTEDESESSSEEAEEGEEEKTTIWDVIQHDITVESETFGAECTARKENLRRKIEFILQRSKSEMRIVFWREMMISEDTQDK